MSARARRVGLPSPRHVVVDGSNLATEGRAVPSFDALREAVDAFRAENPGVIVTVVVDASFVHRVDASERSAVEAARLEEPFMLVVELLERVVGEDRCAGAIRDLEQEAIPSTDGPGRR